MECQVCSLEKRIEEKLLGVFRFFETITPEEAEVIKAKIKQNHAQEIEYKEKTIQGYNERYSALQKRLDNLYDDRLDGQISIDFWQRKQKEITDEQAAIQEQLKRLKGEEAKYFEIWLNILDLARRAREIYEKRSPAERRLLLSHLFSNLVLTDEEVAYTLKKPVQRYAERVQQLIDAEKSFELQKTLGKKGRKGDNDLKTNSLLRAVRELRTVILNGWHSYEMEAAVKVLRRESPFEHVD